jgi:hypothetical protein
MQMFTKIKTWLFGKNSAVKQPQIKKEIAVPPVASCDCDCVNSQSITKPILTAYPARQTLYSDPDISRMVMVIRSRMVSLTANKHLYINADSYINMYTFLISALETAENIMSIIRPTNDRVEPEQTVHPINVGHNLIDKKINDEQPIVECTSPGIPSTESSAIPNDNTGPKQVTPLINVIHNLIDKKINDEQPLETVSSGLSDVVSSGLPNTGSSGLPDVVSSGLPNTGSSGLPDVVTTPLFSQPKPTPFRPVSIWSPNGNTEEMVDEEVVIDETEDTVITPSNPKVILSGHTIEEEEPTLQKNVCVYEKIETQS